MKRNVVAGILIAITSVASVVFIVKKNIELAVLFMTIMFAISNAFRAISFREKGHEKEAKWMRGMAIFLGLAVIVEFVMIFM